MGKFKESESLYSEVFEYRVMSLGPDHLKTLSTQNNLGLVNIYLKEYEKALNQLEDANSNILGHKDGFLLKVIVLSNLGLLFIETGEYDRAIDHYERAVSAGLKELGDAHKYTLDAIYGLAEAFRINGETVKAKNRYQQIIKLAEDSADLDSNIVNKSRHRLDEL